MNKTKIKRAARIILSLLKHPKTELSILFVDDEGMQRLNAAFRGRNKTTDVLSFQAEIPLDKDNPYLQNKLQRPVLGDIVINVNIAAARGRISNSDFYFEMYLLLIHGILHLLGYDHASSRHRALLMRKKEREILHAVKKIS